MTQQQVADAMGVTEGRASQIERGRISGQDVAARYADALGGALHQAIHFADVRVCRMSATLRTFRPARNNRGDALMRPAARPTSR